MKQQRTSTKSMEFYEILGKQDTRKTRTVYTSTQKAENHENPSASGSCRARVAGVLNARAPVVLGLRAAGVPNVRALVVLDARAAGVLTARVPLVLRARAAGVLSPRALVVLDLMAAGMPTAGAPVVFDQRVQRRMPPARARS